MPPLPGYPPCGSMRKRHCHLELLRTQEAPVGDGENATTFSFTQFSSVRALLSSPLSQSWPLLPYPSPHSLSVSQPPSCKARRTVRVTGSRTSHLPRPVYPPPTWPPGPQPTFLSPTEKGRNLDYSMKPPASRAPKTIALYFSWTLFGFSFD